MADTINARHATGKVIIIFISVTKEEMLHAASWGEKTADEHGSMVTNLLFPPKVVRHKVNPLSYAPKKESAVFVAPVRVPPPQPSPVIHVGSDGDVLFATVAPMPQRDPDPRPERGSIACLLDGGIQVITSAVGSRGHPDGDNVVERIFSLLRGERETTRCRYAFLVLFLTMPAIL